MRLASVLCLFVLVAAMATLAQTNPVPWVNQPLVPTAIAPGGAGFTLTVNGTGFVSSSVVNWNGTALSTTFVSSSQLTATVPASDIATASTASITVSSPTPGGGTSGALYLGVTNPITSLTFTNYSESFYFAGTVVTPFAVVLPVAGDFNNDGKLDLAFIAWAIISTTSPTFQACIELGNGDGSFQLPTCTPVSPPMAGKSESPLGLVAADFNGDGKLDLALSNGYDGTNTVSIFLGNGDGTLQAPRSFSAGPPTPEILSVADFNGDGKLDLAVVNSEISSQGDVSILLGNGDGSFQNPIEYALSFTTGSLVVGDFNRDGNLDLVLSTTGTDNGVSYNDLYLGLGNGDGTFQTPQQVANLGTSSPGSTVTADVNGDGRLDLVTLTDVSYDVAGFAVLLGNGDGTFQPPVTYSTPYYAYGGPVIADINGDGKPDLLLAPWSQDGSNTVDITLVSALIGNGDGTFQGAINLPTPALPVGGYGGPIGLLAGDFNGDGKVDMLLAYDDSYPSLAPTGSFFFFVQGSFPAAGASPTSIAFAQQAVGSTSSPQSLTLTNMGGTVLAISGITLGGQDARDFAESNQCSASLAVGASCQINVTFTPTAFGMRNGTLIVANDGLGGTQGIALTGTTPPGVSVSLSPPNVSFPSQYVGTAGLPQTLTVTNTGTAALTVTNVAASIADFGTLSNCTNSVPPNTNCTIGVFFDPTTSGTRSGTLTITDNASGSPQTVTLNGTGQDFSMAASGQTTATLTPGQTATYMISVAPGGGFKQTVTLSCSGAPAQSTCSVSPSSIALGSSASTVTVTVATAGSSASLTRPFGRPPYGGATARFAWSETACGLLGLGISMSFSGWRRQRRQGLAYGLALLCLLSIGVTLSACGGGSSSSGGGGTQPGTYNLTVAGSFSSGSTTLTHNIKLTLVVQ
jgi:hypothetical protein